MILHGDCIEQSEQIESGSVDLILTDPPFGTMKGIKAQGYEDFESGYWDNAIEPKRIFEIANRILRKNGKLILFSQEPYTSELITNAIPNLPFGYRMIWEKNDFANALLAKKAPVSYFEDILVFSKNHDFEGLHPLREYFKKVIKYIGLNLKQINTTIGHRRAEHSFYVDSSQFSLCTEETYNELIKVFAIDKMQDFKSFQKLQEVNDEFNDEFNSVFNLWEGKKYKSNILKYKKDYSGHHPTQKPVALLEDLIKTYSNENNLVVDLTCGSGSTAVAAIRTNRRFVVIEKEEKYYNIAKQRIEQEQNALKLF